MLESLTPDIFIGIESKLDASVTTNEFLPPSYSIQRLDRNLNGGGIFIAAKMDIITEPLDHSKKCELTWTKLTLQSGKAIIIGAFYRPPNSALQVIQDLYDEITNIKQRFRNATILIGGDFNLPGIDWSTQTHRIGSPNKQDCELFLDMLMSESLEQLNREPTRGSNILDLCISSEPELVHSCTTGPGISDHEHLLIIRCKCKVRQNKKKSRHVHLYKKANWENARTQLKIAWEFFFNQTPEHNSVDTNWAYFKDTIRATIDKCVPSKNTSGKYRPPWFTSEINRLIRKRQRSYNKAKKSSKEADWTRFVNIRKETQTKLRKAHQEYVNKLISDENCNTKDMWRYLKGLRKDSCGVSTLVANGTSAHTPHDKAQMLNKQFSSVFTKEDLRTSPIIPKRNIPKMPPVKVTEKGVLNLLQKLNTRKACGSDGIPAIFLKSCARELCTPLAFIIQQTINLKAVPNDWREAMITPIFKKGDRTSPGNYRPVSLTSICCKIAEHIIVSQTMAHLEKHHLLSENQHGFRRKRSCETQLMLTTHDFAQALNRRSQIDVAVLDFEKAFDKVAHQRLIRKLYHLNIDYDVVGWIASFLFKRVQRVVVDGDVSDYAPVQSGVPQGTVVGPMLFLIFIDDIKDGITSTTRLFADDCLIYREITSREDAQELQNDIHKLHNWSRQWQMNFNIKKCNIMTITNARKNVIKYKYFMNGEPMERTDKIDYLGVKITNKLTWDVHINGICGSAKRVLGFLRRTLHHTSKDIRLKAYQTMVRPKVEYASAIWDPHLSNCIEKLEMVQKAGARFVLNKRHRRTATQESVTQMVRDLQWDTLESRRKKSRLVLLYKTIKQQVAIPAKYHPVPKISNYDIRGNPDQFTAHQPNVNAYKYAFIPRTIEDWNELSPEATQAKTLEAFKLSLSKNT